MKTIAVRLSQQDYAKLSRLAGQDNTTPTNVLRELIYAFLDEVGV